MLSGLWLGILLGFAVITDYTVQKTNWENIHPFMIEYNVDIEILYFDKIEIVDGYYMTVKDSTYSITSKNYETYKRSIDFGSEGSESKRKKEKNKKRRTN
jgi:hypothetical protein